MSSRVEIRKRGVWLIVVWIVLRGFGFVDEVFDSESENIRDFLEILIEIIK